MAKTNETTAKNAFGLTAEEAETVQDIKPSLSLKDVLPNEGDSIRVRIISEKPQSLTGKDMDGNDEEVPVIEVTDVETGVDYNLWLGSKALRREFFKVAREHNDNFANVEVIVSMRMYDHEKYGRSRGYRVQTVRSNHNAE